MTRIAFFLSIFLGSCMTNYRTIELNKQITLKVGEELVINYNFEKIYYRKDSKELFFRLIVNEKFHGKFQKIYYNSFFKVKVNGIDMLLTYDENGTSEPVSSQWRCAEFGNTKFTRTYAVHNDELSKFYNLSPEKFYFEILDHGYRFSVSEVEEIFEDCE